MDDRETEPGTRTTVTVGRARPFPAAGEDVAPGDLVFVRAAPGG